MIVKVSYLNYDISVTDLYKLFKRHSDSFYIDNDSKSLIITNPNSYLLEELENRGITYKVLGDVTNENK